MGLCEETSLTIVEKQVPGAEGGERWERWTHRALFDDSGAAVEYQSVGEDVTDRKLAERELERLADMLEQHLDIERIMRHLAIGRD